MPNITGLKCKLDYVAPFLKTSRLFISLSVKAGSRLAYSHSGFFSCIFSATYFFDQYLICAVQMYIAPIQSFSLYQFNEWHAYFLGAKSKYFVVSS